MQFFLYIITILFVDGIYAECGRASTEKAPASYKNITRLNLANSNLLTIKRQTFNNYQKLEELNIINSKLTSVEDGAFHDLLHLKEVNMSNNFIERLNPEVFTPRSKLWKLAVSNNMLSNIDSFNTSYFPALTHLDVSNNLIRSLPVNFVEKLREDANFTLIATDNPLDCENGNWSRFLSEDLYAKFCSNIERLPQPQERLKAPTQASFLTCLFWIVGAFWCGVIVGNICLIKRILFSKKIVGKADQSVQCDIHNLNHVFIKTEYKPQQQEILSKPSENLCYV